MAKYKVTLHLPHTLRLVEQRVLEGHNDVVVKRNGGYVGELSNEQLAVAKADPYLLVEKAGAATEDPEAAAKAQAKKEAKAKAAAEAKAKKDAEAKAKADKAAKAKGGQKSADKKPVGEDSKQPTTDGNKTE